MLSFLLKYLLCFDQKHRLGIILKVVNTHLGIPQDAETKWTVDGENTCSSYTDITSLHIFVHIAMYIIIYALNLHTRTCTLMIYTYI